MVKILNTSLFSYNKITKSHTHRVNLIYKNKKSILIYKMKKKKKNLSQLLKNLYYKELHKVILSCKFQKSYIYPYNVQQNLSQKLLRRYSEPSQLMLYKQRKLTHIVQFTMSSQHWLSLSGTLLLSQALFVFSLKKKKKKKNPVVLPIFHKSKKFTQI